MSKQSNKHYLIHYVTV